MLLAVRARSLAGLCAAGIMLASAAFAQDKDADGKDITASHLKAAHAALEATKSTDRFDNILLAASVQLKNNLLQKNPDMESAINSTVDDKTLAIASRRGDLEREAALAYARVFSEDELNAIAAFYDTEAGKKLLDKGPLVAAEIYKAAEIWQRGVIRDLAQSVSQEMESKMPKPPAVPAADQQPAPKPAPAKSK